MPATASLSPRLVAVTREQYLWQNEARITAAALIAAAADPLISRHFAAVSMAEGLVDVHDAAAIRQATLGADKIAMFHQSFATDARQLKLHHLDHLANLVL